MRVRDIGTGGARHRPVQPRGSARPAEDRGWVLMLRQTVREQVEGSLASVARRYAVANIWARPRHTAGTRAPRPNQSAIGASAAGRPTSSPLSSLLTRVLKGSPPYPEQNRDKKDEKFGGVLQEERGRPDQVTGPDEPTDHDQQAAER